MTLPPFCLTLQQFVAEQAAKGFLVCLCSKNEESDVLEVFNIRADMPLRREHLVAWRINWERKSENLRSLAEELNLGLNAFVFIDDNPVECAEVRANCPDVLPSIFPLRTMSADSFPTSGHSIVCGSQRKTGSEPRCIARTRNAPGFSVKHAVFRSS